VQANGAVAAQAAKTSAGSIHESGAACVFQPTPRTGRTPSKADNPGKKLKNSAIPSRIFHMSSAGGSEDYMKTFLRKSKASGSTLRRIEKAVARHWRPGCGVRLRDALKRSSRRPVLAGGER